MRILDILRGSDQAYREQETLKKLQARASQHSANAESYRQEFCVAVVNDVLGPIINNPSVIHASLLLCHSLLSFEGHFHLPQVVRSGGLTTAETWKAKAALTNALAPFEQPRVRELLY